MAAPARKRKITEDSRPFKPGKTPASNCACRDPESTARFVVQIDDSIICSWCGGDYALLEKP